MGVKIEPVTIENFEDLPVFRLFPYSCKFCAYWESLTFDDKTSKEDAEQIKRQWIVQVSKEFGNCGFIVYVNDKPVGFAQYAPPKYFPAIGKYDTEPSEDAIFLACLYISRRELWGKGIGKRLLEKIVDDLRGRGHRSIETFAYTKDAPSRRVEDCYVGPAEFFLKMGFAVKDQREQIVLMRKDLYVGSNCKE
jgi:GNAT superfamily N-acetyltransferase